jgi:catechol 2,3-dioxygenase-like lactoylglutathione lyase family enzyme
MKTNGIDHVAINVEDIDASCSWYVENLNATLEYSDETWAMLDIAGSKLALTIATEHPPHMAFSVEEFSTDDTSFHRDGTEYVYLKDPDGNTIEIICRSSI